MANTSKKTSTLASYIDQTLLKPDATREQIIALCQEGIKHEFAGICIPQYFVQTARNTLGESKVKLVTVIGFPMGYNMTSSKAEEAKKAISDGADELDMVMNMAAFKSGNYAFVKDDIESITTLCRLRTKKIKVIIETALLSEDEIKKACEICANCEVDFVKTSTGFNGEGAKAEDIKLMREVLPKKIGIKASGGIRDAATAKEMIDAGANRIGTSSGIKIIENED